MLQWFAEYFVRLTHTPHFILVIFDKVKYQKALCQLIFFFLKKHIYDAIVFQVKEKKI